MKRDNKKMLLQLIPTVGMAVLLVGSLASCGFVSPREYPASTPTPTYSEDNGSTDGSSPSGNGVDVIIIDPSKPSPTSSSIPSTSAIDTQQEIALAYQELLSSMYNMDKTQYDAYQNIATTYPTLEAEQVPMINTLMLNTFPWLDVVNTENISDKELNIAYASLVSQAAYEYEQRAAETVIEVKVPSSAVSVEYTSTAFISPELIEITKDGQSVSEGLGKEGTVSFVNVSGQEWKLYFEGML